MNFQSYLEGTPAAIKECKVSSGLSLQRDNGSNVLPGPSFTYAKYSERPEGPNLSRGIGRCVWPSMDNDSDVSSPSIR